MRLDPVQHGRVSCVRVGVNFPRPSKSRRGRSWRWTHWVPRCRPYRAGPGGSVLASTHPAWAPTSANLFLLVAAHKQVQAGHRSHPAAAARRRPRARRQTLVEVQVQLHRWQLAAAAWLLRLFLALGQRRCSSKVRRGAYG